MTVDASRFNAAYREAESRLHAFRGGIPFRSDAQCDRLDREIQRLDGLARKYERSKPGRARYYRRKADEIQRELSHSYSWLAKRISKHFFLQAGSYWAEIRAGFATWSLAAARVAEDLRLFSEQLRVRPVRAVSTIVVSPGDVVSQLREISDELQGNDQLETSRTPGTDNDAAR